VTSPLGEMGNSLHDNEFFYAFTMRGGNAPESWQLART